MFNAVAISPLLPTLILSISCFYIKHKFT